MTFWNIISLIFISCLIIYYYFKRQMNLFEKAGIPCEKPWPIVGNYLPILLKKTTIAEFILKLYNSNPKAKYIGFFEYRRPVILLRDPEIIKSVGMNHEVFPNRRGFDIDGNNDEVMGKEIFSAKNEKWEEMRKTLSPAFTPTKLKILLTLISQKTKIFLNHILQNEKSAVDINCLKLIQKYIIDIIHTCNYGIETKCILDDNEDFYNFCFQAGSFENLETNKQFQLLSSFVSNIFEMPYLDEKVRKYFRNIVEYSIAKRKNSKKFSENALDLVIDSANKKNKTIKDITAQAYFLFAASFETTSTILTYLCYHLAVNYDVQEKIQKEIDSLENKEKISFNRKTSTLDQDSNSFQPTMEDIDNLKYLDAAIKETLRIHSLLPLERESVKKYQLPPALPGLKPFTIEPGTLVLLPIEPINQDPQYFPQPTKFMPERFFLETNNSFSPLPFGIGHRKCLGNRLAPLILKLFIVHTLIRCNIKTCSKTPITLNVSNKNVTKTPEKEIWLRIERRKIQTEKKKIAQKINL